MAKHTDANGREYAIVDSVDNCLWTIAERYLNSGYDYTKLVNWNKDRYPGLVANPNLVHNGQKIYLSADGSSGGGGSSSATVVNTNMAQISEGCPALISTSDNELYATWTWHNEANTESYKTVWTYSTGEGVEWEGKVETITLDHDKGLLPLYCQDTFTVPTGAIKVWFKVKPIAIKDKKGDSDTPRFEAEWSKKETWTNLKAVPVPDTPDVTLSGLTLKAKAKDVDVTGNLTIVEFQVIKNNTINAHQDKVDINKEFPNLDDAIEFVDVSKEWAVVPDGKYKVRCRLHADYPNPDDPSKSLGTFYSEWSAFSEEVVTEPAAPKEIKTIRALSETSVYLDWDPVATATEYEAQYTTDITYFDSNQNEVQSNTVTQDPENPESTSHMEITGMESGKKYYFRLRAKNINSDSSNQVSDWTEIAEVIIGTVPEAPTTWSSSTTVVVGEPLTLYWSHNCEDGSKWRYAEIRLIVDGVQIVPDHQEDNPTAGDEDEDTVGSYVIDTSIYPEGTKLDWQVRTMGIVSEYGEWSTQRTVDIHAQPTLDLSVTKADGSMVETLTGFPLYIRALAGPSTQAPLSYHLSVVANETYETTDYIGNPIFISKGEEVYSKHFDTTENPLMVELSAGNVDFENNISYTVLCTAAMNSGLTAEATKTFTVSWTNDSYIPNAAIGINTDVFSAQIRPYCETRTSAQYKVSLSNGVYTITDELVPGVLSDAWIYDEETGLFVENPDATGHIPVGTTATGENVYHGTFTDDTEGYYCTVETVELVGGVTLGVYRREFDGGFTEIATGIENAWNTFVTDPHPALDFARYRIVATTVDTGAVAYYDVPAVPVRCPSIILQWNEEWSNFDATEDAALVQPPWSGSMLKLPYNIDVSDSNSPDVALVEYAGRKNAVSYYGTYIGQTSTWSTDIPKSDKETLYAIRRLAVWLGDVYVREPSGSGYWANVKVTYNQTHKEVTIPVTLSIARVEGGV